jgi:hypothetical protein
MIRKIIFICVLLLPAQASGQSQGFHQFLYWVRFQTYLTLSPRLYWTNEADNRRFFDPDVENQLIFHSRLHYKKGPWDLAAGLTLSSAFAQRPEIGYSHATTELRPVAELSHELQTGKMSIQNRIRIDNRFFEVDEEKSIWEESRYVMRWRYRIQARIPLKKKEEQTTVTLRVSDEIMFNHVENFFDQNRLYVTVDFFLNKKLSFETGFIEIYQQRFGTSQVFYRHVWRSSLQYRIN